MGRRLGKMTGRFTEKGLNLGFCIISYNLVGLHWWNRHDARRRGGMSDSDRIPGSQSVALIDGSSDVWQTYRSSIANYLPFYDNNASCGHSALAACLQRA